MFGATKNERGNYKVENQILTKKKDKGSDNQLIKLLRFFLLNYSIYMSKPFFKKLILNSMP